MSRYTCKHAQLFDAGGTAPADVSAQVGSRSDMFPSQLYDAEPRNANARTVSMHQPYWHRGCTVTRCDRCGMLTDLEPRSWVLRNTGFCASDSWCCLTCNAAAASGTTDVKGAVSLPAKQVTEHDRNAKSLQDMCTHKARSVSAPQEGRSYRKHRLPGIFETQIQGDK